MLLGEYQKAAIRFTTCPKARARGGLLGRHGVNVLEAAHTPRYVISQAGHVARSCMQLRTR